MCNWLLCAVVIVTFLQFNTVVNKWSVRGLLLHVYSFLEHFLLDYLQLNICIVIRFSLPNSPKHSLLAAYFFSAWVICSASLFMSVLHAPHVRNQNLFWKTHKFGKVLRQIMWGCVVSQVDASGWLQILTGQKDGSVWVGDNHVTRMSLKYLQRNFHVTVMHGDHDETKVSSLPTLCYRVQFRM
jgi:hypothetical protein